MGMPAAEFWDGESSLVFGYRKAYQIRMQNQERTADRDAWLHGLYTRMALQSVALLVNGFVPRGTTAEEYPKIPLTQKAEEEKKAEVKKQNEENQMKLAMAMMQAAVKKFNRNFERRQAEKAAAVTS